VVEPSRSAAASSTAFDHLREEVRTFSLHRITGVAELAEGS